MGAYSDTICALVTPPGVGGLAVVRLSGPDALVIADRCFRGKQPLQGVPTHTIHYGRFLRGEELVDMVTASVFRAPRSYTGEDTVEFGCHGSMVVADEIVAALIEAGARLAEPGEFTRRAFLNGKLDLTQVEAVADLIYATSVPGARLAARQLVGGLTQRLRHLREQLLQAAALLELELDFAEEDLEFVPREVLLHQLSQGEAMCRRLAESYRAAQVLRSGFFVGLVGYPNAGKSSLFNALLQRQRAIVSPLPGTTRDYLEESLYLDGIPVRLIDTAGVREAADTIELQGIALAQEAIRQCNVLLLINDATCGVEHSQPLLEELQQCFPQMLIACVQNKVDLLPEVPLRSVPLNGAVPTFWVSALRGDGLEELRYWLSAQARQSAETGVDVLINARQAHALMQSAEAIAAARQALLQNLPGEFVAAELRRAVETVSELTGDTWREDVLNAIFERFCIGK
jgi:tRNA modification GTPase